MGVGGCEEERGTLVLPWSLGGHAQSGGKDLSSVLFVLQPRSRLPTRILTSFSCTTAERVAICATNFLPRGKGNKTINSVASLCVLRNQLRFRKFSWATLSKLVTVIF